MKNIIRFFLIALSVIFFAPNAFSDETQDDSPVKPVRLEKKILQNGPRTIPMLYLDGTYSIGYIEFALPSEISYAEVTFGRDENTVVWSGFITPDFPGCDTPHLVGEYFVTCTFDNGAAYQGVIVF